MKSFLARNGQNGKAKPGESSDLVPVGEEGQEQDAPQPINKLTRTDAFDKPVILQQSSFWSRGILWGIIGVTSFTIIWASLAPIEEAVPATGKLEPQERVQEIQAPVGGVVEEILVEDGQRVNKGDVLIRFDPRTTAAQLQSLQQIRTSLVQENQFYRAQMLGVADPTPEEAAKLNLRPEVLQLTINRSALLQENQLYQAQLRGGSAGNLSPEQQTRLRVGLIESNSRAAAAQFEVEQLQQQFNQARSQLQAARQSLDIDQGILADIRPLAEEGGIARIQLRQQEQKVLNSSSEVERLQQEEQRLQYAIAQAQQQFQNTIAVTGNDLLNRIADNEKRLTEIDSQLNKAIVENQKRISEIDGQIEQANVTLQYQELRAPIDGVVFDLQAKGTGFVANTSEPILKIVPNEGLTAQVFITNKDIGFVTEGMRVDVRIDSFPFSEFGDVKGTVVRIGSDALPPNEIYQFYRFPTTIRLDEQVIDVHGQKIPLQSGMSVTANIITRNRKVISIFIDMFRGKVDSLNTVR